MCWVISTIAQYEELVVITCVLLLFYNCFALCFKLFLLYLEPHPPLQKCIVPVSREHAFCFLSLGLKQGVTALFWWHFHTVLVTLPYDVHYFKLSQVSGWSSNRQWLGKRTIRTLIWLWTSWWVSSSLLSWTCLCVERVAFSMTANLWLCITYTVGFKGVPKWT